MEALGFLDRCPCGLDASLRVRLPLFSLHGSGDEEGERGSPRKLAGRSRRGAFSGLQARSLRVAKANLDTTVGASAVLWGEWQGTEATSVGHGGNLCTQPRPLQGGPCGSEVRP